MWHGIETKELILCWISTAIVSLCIYVFIIYLYEGSFVAFLACYMPSWVDEKCYENCFGYKMFKFENQNRFSIKTVAIVSRLSRNVFAKFKIKVKHFFLIIVFVATRFYLDKFLSK